ncbi:membrane integrity-associated transporter subunit PqiC [Pseudogulbenkiania sp. MAI-1]|uniref:PqiC family protein n=1 Tax=Pseudogulbenkiania sp. MAI-1 TaxID=990370 RepID=UPI00045EA94C|nr:ABC-type transport auxiliary lipoprotein family protein [Pseudogulbenkiania sp. MAI-1]
MTRLPGLTLLALLAGCASSPAVHYYRLTDDTASATAPAAAVVGNILVTVRLPDYLNDRHIVYQSDDVTIEAARHSLWAEAPEQAIPRRLSAELGQRLPRYGWTTPLAAGSSSGPTLLVVFDQFNGRFDGRAVLSGHWLLRDGRQTTPARQPFRIEVVQRGDGYPALVRALNQGLAELAGEISQKLPAPAFKPS